MKTIEPGKACTNPIMFGSVAMGDDNPADNLPRAPREVARV